MRQLPPSNLGPPAGLSTASKMVTNAITYYECTSLSFTPPRWCKRMTFRLLRCLSGTCTTCAPLTNLTSFARPCLRFPRLCFLSAVYAPGAWWWKAHCAKDPRVRAKMKSSIADYFITQNGEREETSRGRSIKGSAGETQHFPFIFMETSCIPAAAATEVESGSTLALHWTRTQQTTRR